MKNSTAVALSLWLCFHIANARIPHSYRQLQERNDEVTSHESFLAWASRLFKRQNEAQGTSQDVCLQDEYYGFVTNSSFGENFCELLGIDYPNRTVVVDYTPVV